MNLIDIIAIYLYALKNVALVLLVLLLFFALDDLFIDIYYWLRRSWRGLTIYRNRSVFDEQQLYFCKEKPIAIMIPAWQEVGVVGKMAELAASELDYENYQIFVGTYPNDPGTQEDVDAVCRRFPNIHKVVCARPGPTSKADCLNNVITSILEFERRSKVKFSGFVLHDAEDVISAMELRLFNYLLPRKDLIQLPVYPFATGALHFTSGHYLDEFSEMHGKDVVVREAIVGQVPSAGVGTCFSRRAILKLSEEGDGLPFDVQSLTEDYDIGFRMKQWGMEEIFVRFSVTNNKLAAFAEKNRSRSKIDGNVVCVREYFPETFQTAVRQKSRWIIGIVFQGIKVHKWSKDWKLNYFLWRDRKGVVSYFVSFLANIIFIQLALLWLYQAIAPNAYNFIGVFSDDPIIIALLSLNLVFFLNRILQRMIFVRRYYGIVQAFLSVPRQLWGNIINFFANVRAIRQVVQYGDPRRVAWDKTQHQYPTVSERSLGSSLGSILMQQGVIRTDQLNTALEHRVRGERLGQAMLRLELISPVQLAEALALQASTECRLIDPFMLEAKPIVQFPERLAFKYAVLPIGMEDGTLLLAKESALSPVAQGAIERLLQRKVRYVICQAGAVTLGLRYWYMFDKSCNPEQQLAQWCSDGDISESAVKTLRERYFSCQLMLGEALLQASLLEPALINQVMMGYEYDGNLKLGAYLVQEQLISEQVLEQTLMLQQSVQKSLQQLFAEYKQASGEAVIA
ncbi:adsorption protein B [Arsukibacterium tuosuense]|uniref:Adsorption protein B n=1 Tax=Arsukibacterium tuosuense TaxID=1323745 RepID=A0A285IM14_9GAMM|nr:glycosyl transferase family protein [Arsukibacterium tuosuense]SNY49018.1 adsorption protein B [Arsukibacterium tuosuense]